MTVSAGRAPRCAARFLGLLSFALLLAAPQAAAQGVGAETDTTLAVLPGDTALGLGRRFILGSTFSLSSDSTAFSPGADYRLDARNGVLTLLGPLRSFVGRAGQGGVRLRARFEYLPISLPAELRLREPAVVRDSATGAADTVYRTAAEFGAGDFFGPGLRRSGSLVRGIEAGSNRDVTLNSGFRLQMSGNLADDLEIAASLTDENSPIQPEGATRTLQELDRVFIELRGRNAAATVGDLSLGYSEGRFGRMNRKLRGAVGSWSADGDAVRGAAEAGAASVRGKYVVNRFAGGAAGQGPYRLTGKSNEFPVIVIAGTERVYVDGRQMTRGLSNDYTVDYGLGEVTFTARRRIDFASRIVVEFEYADRRYARDYIGGRARFGGVDGSWEAGGMVASETDDRDALTDMTLSDADRSILEAAGDAQESAARSGIEFAGPGSGKYELRDTTVEYPSAGGAVDTVVLVYNPVDTVAALYNATFTHVGAGKGDYERVAAGHYRFAGPGRGAYLPVRLLPFAERHAFANLTAGGRIGGGLSVSGEYAASSLDRNTFSPRDDGDNAADAYDLALAWASPGSAAAPPGRPPLGITLRQRRIGAGFAAPERFNDVEFDRDWNADAGSPGRDLVRDAEVSAVPYGAWRLGAYAGRLERGSDFSSTRYSSVTEAGDDLRYAIERLRSDDSRRGLSSERLRQEGAASRAFGRLTPRLLFRDERLEERTASSPGLGAASYAFTEVVPGVLLDSVHGMSFSLDAGFRRDDSVRGGSLTAAVRTWTQSYGWTYDGGGAVNSSLDLRVEKRRFDAGYAAKNTLNTALVRSLTRVSPWGRVLQADVYYEAGPEQASRLERVFVRVPRGTGGYRYAGDLNANGTVDEPDFRPARYDGDYSTVTLPSDRLVPAVNVRASGRLRFDLSDFARRGTGSVPGFLRPFSGETYIRVEEKSTDSVRRNLYLLRVGTFRNPSTTLQGSVLFLQELSLFDLDPGFSAKFRFQERRAFTRLSGGDELAYARERGVRVLWSLGEELANRVEFRHLTDEVRAVAGAVRDRSVDAALLDLEWTYRPAGEVESTFGVSVGDADNYEHTSASLNAQRISVAYLLRTAGRLRAEFSREEAIVSGESGDLPYELTLGRIPGKTWIWGVGLEYRLTRFLESSMRYEGRKEGFLRVNHAGSMEVKAIF